MAVYLIAEIEEIINRNIYNEYISKVSEIVEKYGGKYLVRGGEIVPISGNWNPNRVVILEFNSQEDLINCFNSPEYNNIAPLREKSTKGRAICVDGINSE